MCWPLLLGVNFSSVKMPVMRPVMVFGDIISWLLTLVPSRLRVTSLSILCLWGDSRFRVLCWLVTSWVVMLGLIIMFFVVMTVSDWMKLVMWVMCLPSRQFKLLSFVLVRSVAFENRPVVHVGVMHRDSMRTLTCGRLVWTWMVVLSLLRATAGGTCMLATMMLGGALVVMAWCIMVLSLGVSVVLFIIRRFRCLSRLTRFLCSRVVLLVIMSSTVRCFAWDLG